MSSLYYILLPLCHYLNFARSFQTRSISEVLLTGFVILQSDLQSVVLQLNFYLFADRTIDIFMDFVFYDRLWKFISPNNTNFIKKQKVQNGLLHHAFKSRRYIQCTDFILITFVKLNATN